MVGLVFRSGLHLIVGAVAARALPNGFVREGKLSSHNFESVFAAAVQSGYDFHKHLYEFTPDKMHLWALSPSLHYREQFLLNMKEVVLAGSSADTGIFNVQNQNWRGFQLGDPNAHPRRIAVHLYSGKNSVELTFAGKDGRGPVAVTQSEINRIVESLHEVPQDGQGSKN